MTDLLAPLSKPPLRARLHLLERLLAEPALLFGLFSLAFGTLLIVLTPPLRGPDEAAHFLRAYGIAQGEIIPLTVDHEGRKGIHLPAYLHEGFAHFEATQARERIAFGAPVLKVHPPARVKAENLGRERSPVFVRYEGSEGYAPAAYLPHVVAAVIARSAHLNFSDTVYLMRFAGLAAMTAALAYAIKLVPYLNWVFVTIAMLPAALYGRAVISADAGALACAMVVIALCLRRAMGGRAPDDRHISLWMALCVLTKPPQLAFILLALMPRPSLGLIRRWRSVALIMLPALTASLLWAVLSSGDAGAWRLVELTGRAPHQFEPAWKLGFMVEHPLHFPKAVLATFPGAGEQWRQLIGVLGLFDTPLQPWMYPTLSAFLMASFLTPVNIESRLKYRLVAVATLTVAGYGLAVFLILFLVWTPIDAEQVWGVQGRYFIPALPVFAVAVAALVTRGATEGTNAVLAISAAFISGLAAAEAVLRAEWQVF